jgi:hypothetical protein
LTARASEEKGQGSTAVARRPFAGRKIDRRAVSGAWRSGRAEKGIDHEFVMVFLDAFLRLCGSEI